MAGDEIRRLRVVEGGNSPKPYHRRGALNQVVCRVCEADTGIATSQFIETLIAPFERGGKLEGEPTKGIVCAWCLSRGKVTRVL